MVNYLQIELSQFLMHPNLNNKNHFRIQVKSALFVDIPH